MKHFFSFFLSVFFGFAAAGLPSGAQSQTAACLEEMISDPENSLSPARYFEALHILSTAPQDCSILRAVVAGSPKAPLACDTAAGILADATAQTTPATRALMAERFSHCPALVAALAPGPLREPDVNWQICTPFQHAGIHGEVCAETVLPPQSGNTYGPTNLFDMRRETAWVEGVAGTGEGQRILFRFADPVELSALGLRNGYTKSPRLFTRNARLSKLIISDSSGASRSTTVADSFDWQELDIAGNAPLHWLMLEIAETQAGSHYPDTAISEVVFQR